jgi:hypothetical protein
MDQEIPTSPVAFDRKIQVIVMRSGKNNVVQKGLAMAFKKCPERFDVKYIRLGKKMYMRWSISTNDKNVINELLLLTVIVDAKIKGWKSEDFCEFAKNCDVFIFTCHPVQGDEPPLWDFREHLRRLYDVLKHKITFPDNPKALLEDPVFRQDKVQLYEVLSEYMTPTITIPRPQPGMTFEKSTIRQIYDFGKRNYEVQPKYGVGVWYIKTSFATNNRGVTRALKLVKAPRLMMAMYNRWGLHSVPDCLFQRTFANSIVIVINIYLFLLIILLIRRNIF